ncbi:hypothetical protein Drose_34975 [Dactylosporangium roseum]|uniref:dihydrouracil dehydrogenase (NAD(+)) n=1 Tax=Dactylosporangium roseum TaxID=47989 RepID=A0ABY5Z2F3_9ACTN|nr:hypothetical protein [Dactylosporangium roseum]UWZ36203.1 hypothetical protein Drose_34975 [Dactylosporangium roseum]
MNSGVDSRVDFLGLALSSPIIVGSGLLTDQERNIRRLLECGAGGVITKTIHPNPPRGGNEQVVRIATGMLNSTTYSRRSVEHWCEVLRAADRDDLSVIASIHADSPAELGDLSEAVAATGCRALELGISCLNEEGFEDSPQRVFAYTDAVRRRVSIPIIVKLAVDGGTAARVNAAVRAGADAVTLSDTIPGLAVDPQTGEVALGGAFGYSGAGLKPIVLAEIFSMRKRGIDVPVMASGGVQTGTDVVEYLSIGADVVQVYSALHQNMYETLRAICDGFHAWLAERHTDARQVIGRSLVKADR